MFSISYENRSSASAQRVLNTSMCDDNHIILLLSSSMIVITRRCKHALRARALLRALYIYRRVFKKGATRKHAQKV